MVAIRLNNEVFQKEFFLSVVKYTQIYTILIH